MNRSIERRHFITTGTVPGEILVGRFTHPTRGRVRCPATPLLAASARRAGCRVREVACLAESAPDERDGDGVLFTASYLDRAGQAVGLAAAAHRTDVAGLTAARDAVSAWSAVWRTRRVMIADSGAPCYGVKRAETLADQAPATPRHWISSLEDLAQLNGEATALLPVHGSPPRVRAFAQALGLPVIDTTCPLVARAHAEARLFAERGDHVVVIGTRAHAGTPALLAQAPERTVIVESDNDVAGLQLPADRVRYLIQPGTAIDKAMHVLASLRVRYPKLRGTHPDQICYATSDQLDTLRVVAHSCDLLLHLGRPTPAQLHAMAGSCVQILEDPRDLRPAWLAGAECVGVVATSPSAKHSLPDLVQLLSGLGPISIAHKRVTTRIDTDTTGESTAN